MKMRSKAACMIGAFAALAMLAGCSEPEAKAYKLGPGNTIAAAADMLHISFEQAKQLYESDF